MGSSHVMSCQIKSSHVMLAVCCSPMAECLMMFARTVAWCRHHSCWVPNFCWPPACPDLCHAHFCPEQLCMCTRSFICIHPADGVSTSVQVSLLQQHSSVWEVPCKDGCGHAVMRRDKRLRKLGMTSARCAQPTVDILHLAPKCCRLLAVCCHRSWAAN